MQRQCQFVNFEVLAAVLGVSVKKLRTSLDPKTGEIRLGGNVPPIQSLKIGRLRVVASLVLERWLEQIGAAARQNTDEETEGHLSTPATAARRGRPRLGTGGRP